MWRRVFGAVVLSGLLSASVHAEKKCELQKYAELPIAMRHMRPLIRGTINGEPARFLVDSGAFFSFLSDASAKKFGLELGLLPFGMTIDGANGWVKKVSKAEVRDLTLLGYMGGRALHHIDFIVGGNPAAYSDHDGLIGQDFLGNTDIEYDLANGVIRLFVARHCHNTMLAYWAETAPVAIMDIHRLTRQHNHVIGTALLNGKKIRVMFDSGTSRSVLALRAAKRVGITPLDDDVVDAGIGGGVARRRMEQWITHFDSLNLGGEVIKNARLRISDMDSSRLGTDMLLGADFFLSHRIYVSKSQRRLYFTYNGGPVFDLRDANVKAKMGGTAANDDPLTAENTDAANLKRRAMASAQRHEFSKAIAQFNAVIKLVPNDADNYLQRALAHLGNRQSTLALDDLDQALKIKPGLVRARIVRGSVRLQNGDDRGAGEDFDAAVHFAAGDPTVHADIAHEYLSANRFVEAIAQLDAYVAASPDSNQLPFALTQRCRARALANRQLDLALADCKKALKKVRGDSRMLANLALVYLRLGNYDKAIGNYRASIRLQPKNARAIYGLGIAEKRNGLRADGAESMRSALALQPEVAADFRRIGLQPDAERPGCAAQAARTECSRVGKHSE